MHTVTQRQGFQLAALFSKSHLWRARIHLYILMLFVCSSLMACSNRETLWSTSAPSPYGPWIAEAHAYDFSGPGNAAVYTMVYLKRTNVSEPPSAVLVLAQDPDTDLCPQLKWTSATDLEVIFRTKPEFDTQVIKYAGINITVKVEPSNSDKGTQHQPEGIGNICDVVQ